MSGARLACTWRRRAAAGVVTGLLVTLASACASAPSTGGHPASPGRSRATTTTERAPASTSVPTTTVPPELLRPGSHGPAVLALQRRLSALGYWLGTPDGTFDDATEQAVYALQKAAGIGRDGIVGPVTEAALARGALPRPRAASGYVIEVDLSAELLMIVDDGALQWVLNTSTGGGYRYRDHGSSVLAVTPTGHFEIYRQVDGLVVDSLGRLWRPKFFDDGFAIHGDSDVPPVPVSHGCVRVSDEAIDWIWSDDIAPVGTAVWVY